MSTDPLHVGIPTYRRPDLLVDLLNSLVAAAKPPRLGQILVVENGPPAGARDVVGQFTGRLPVRYVHCEESGKGRAMNTLIAALPRGWLVNLDDDVMVSPDLLMQYAKATDASPTTDIFGGPVTPRYEVAPPEWLRPFLPPSVVGWPINPVIARPGDTGPDNFIGSNMTLHTDAIAVAGGYPVNVGPGAMVAGTKGNPTGMERQLLLSLYRRGHRGVFLADASVAHFVPADRCSAAWALDRSARTEVTRVLRLLEPMSPGQKRRHLAASKLWLARSQVLCRVLAWSTNPATHFRGERTLLRAQARMRAHGLAD